MDDKKAEKPMTTNQKIRALIGTILSSGIFAFILYALCTHCYNKAAWFLLLLPFIFTFLLMIMVFAISLGSTKK